ncbi:MAG TPA: ribonuclease T2 [Methyloceanibacter sp.]|nr:ribonuclease T2 [Methyloceanibacter sp.]
MKEFRHFIVSVIALTCLLWLAGAVQAARNVPGAFDYYVLVLSWMPTHCRAEGSGRRECDGPQPHAFLLHGLWPQYDKGWPEDCETGKRPWVSEKVIEEMRDVMPSKNLIIHEYRVHGTCSGLDPAQYFGVARELYERVRVPGALLGQKSEQIASPEAIERAFIDANPWLKPDMIAVTCRRKNLLDIRVCFGRDLFPRACGANEDQQRLCPVSKINVPPAKP